LGGEPFEGLCDEPDLRVGGEDFLSGGAHHLLCARKHQTYLLKKQSDYVVDSGAGIFIHKNCTRTLNTGCQIECANGTKEKALFCEPPNLFSETGEKIDFGDAQGNCFSETIGENIFAIPNALKLGYKIDPEFKHLKTPAGGTVQINQKDGLFYITLYERNNTNPSSKFKALVTSIDKQYSDRRILEEHVRLGHQTQLPKRLKAKCRPCVEGKGTRRPRKKGRYQKWRRAGSAWADLGTLPATYGKYRYFMPVVRWDGETSVFYLQNKSEAHKHLNDFMLKNFDVVRLRTDNGGEFTSRLFREACAKHKLNLSFTSPYHPEDNSIAENGVKRLCGHTRVMMLDSETVIPADKYMLAMSYSNYISNRLARQSLGWKSPHKIRHGIEADLSLCRRFGEKVHYRLRPEQRDSKLTKRFTPAIFVGMCEESNDALLITEENLRKPGFNKRDIIRSSELKYSSDSFTSDLPVFDESDSDSEEQVVFPELYASARKETAAPGNDASFSLDIVRGFLGFLVQFFAIFSALGKAVSQGELQKPRDLSEFKDLHVFKNFMSYKRTTHRAPAHLAFNRRNRRREWILLKKNERKNHRKIWNTFKEYRVNKHLLLTRTLPEDYFQKYGEQVFEVLEEGGHDFQCLATKVKVTDKLWDDLLWVEALKKEYDAFVRQACFEKVDRLPPGEKAIPMCVLAELKENDRRKIRSIVLGNQQALKDAEQNFAPVVNHQTIKLLLQHAVDCDHDLASFDISEAFLYGELSDDQVCYVVPPRQFRQFDPTTRFWKLKKSIYGLRCAPLCWHREYVKRAKELGWKQSEADPCLFRRGKCLKIVYVDDVLISGPAKEAKKARAELMDYFPGRVQDCSEEGHLTFLGMKIRYTKGKECGLSNPAQIAKLLKNLKDTKRAKTPLFVHRELSKEEESDVADGSTYRSIVGSLNYIACISRPDLAYSVQYLSRVLENPGKRELHMANRAMRYVRETASRELILKKNFDFKPSAPSSIIKHVTCYSDADFNAEGKASTGINITVGTTPVHWKSVRQRLSTTSTAEAEYIACAQLVKEICFFSALVADVYGFALSARGEQLECYEVAITPPRPYAAYVDNMAAVKMTEHSGPTARTKHMQVRFGYIKSAVEAGLVRIQHISTTLNRADQFTKCMSRQMLDLLYGDEN
jgi:hypothetical protein